MGLSCYLSNWACMLNHFSLTLSNPMDCSPSGSSVHGILQPRTLECAAMPSSREIFLTQGSNPHLYVSCIDRQVLYHSTTQGAHAGSIYVESQMWCWTFSFLPSQKQGMFQQPGRTAEGIFILTQDYAELSFLSFFFFFLSCRLS